MKYWNDLELVAFWVKSNYPEVFDQAMNDISDKHLKSNTNEYTYTKND